VAGIPEEISPDKILTIFHNQKKGTEELALGLSITLYIVRQAHGGELDIQSQLEIQIFKIHLTL